jgi:hypothetical protein
MRWGTSWQQVGLLVAAALVFLVAWRVAFPSADEDIGFVSRGRAAHVTLPLSTPRISAALSEPPSATTANAVVTTSDASAPPLSPGVAQCLLRMRPCALQWAKHVQPPPNENQAALQWKKGNDCHFGEGRLLDATRALLASHALHFHGDSTLRELMKVIIKFVGVNGNLEKSDANKRHRSARYFDEEMPFGRVRLMFRFDHFPANVNEPLLAAPPSFAASSRVEVICLGVHMADHELVDLGTPYDVAVERMPAAIVGNFTEFLTRANADDRVTAVFVMLQELECEQMGRAVLEAFQKRAKHCPAIERYVGRVNAVITAFLADNPELARKVVTIGPFNCAEEIKPKGASCKGGASACACTKDGIHLRGRYVKMRTESLLSILARGARCRGGAADGGGVV